VLAEGRIAERGTHADLLRRDELYATMWRRQQHGLEETLERERLDEPLHAT
jgi:ATP-binding cassette subfamily B protein